MIIYKQNFMYMTDKYYTDQILTYMGNKRKFVEKIETIIRYIEHVENKPEKSLRIGEAFSGSGILSRVFKNNSSYFFVNDIAGYSQTLNRCYLSNPTKTERLIINSLIDKANEFVENSEEEYEKFISKHWSFHDNSQDKKNRRLYYSYENALRIDKYMHYIKTIHKSHQHFLLAPLLVKCSMHNNTNGQFSAFYKDENGIGKLGGKKEVDLKRIEKKIILPYPLFSGTKSKKQVFRMDANEWVKEIKEVDVMYLDPPYNKHPYNIYYFLLDIINKWDTNIDIPDTNRGQPKNWKKSQFNSFKKAKETFTELINNIKSKWIVLSYNDGGIIPLNEIDKILEEKGNVQKIPIEHLVYNKLKGIASYKRQGENKKVREFLWIVHCKK